MWSTCSIPMAVSEAYRAIPISSTACKLTGLRWDFEGVHYFMFEAWRPFSSSVNPSIFHSISQRIVRMAAKRGYLGCTYLGEFLITGNSERDSYKAFIIRQNLICALGFTINESKTVPPYQSLCFPGIYIDSVNCTLSLPEDKLNQPVQLLQK